MCNGVKRGFEDANNPLVMIDGNEAAATIAHRLSEVCAIYPIAQPRGWWAASLLKPLAATSKTVRW